jgi:hypothetical protein
MCGVEKGILMKEAIRLYGWDKELVKEQKVLVGGLMKLFKKIYEEEIELLKDESRLREKVEKMSVDIFSEMLKIVAKGLQRAFMRGVKKLGKELIEIESNMSIDISFEIGGEYAEEWARKNAGLLVTRVDDYTKKRIGELVANAIKNGDGYNKLVEKLKEDFLFSKSRARLIASNELGNAYISGKEEQFRVMQDKY